MRPLIPVPSRLIVSGVFVSQACLCLFLAYVFLTTYLQKNAKRPHSGPTHLKAAAALAPNLSPRSDTADFPTPTCSRNLASVSEGLERALLSSAISHQHSEVKSFSRQDAATV